METENRLPKRNPFVVPEGYFEELEQSIRNRVSTSGSMIQVPVYRKWLVPSGVFAAILLITVLFIWPTTPTSTPEEILSEVSEEQLSNYLAIHEVISTQDLYFADEALDGTDEEELFLNAADTFVNLN